MQTRDDCDAGDGLNPTRMQTRDISDAVDVLNPNLALPDNDNVDEEKKKDQQIMVKLVLDMCSPLYGTGKVVNTDNYYTSPTIFAELYKNVVYARGTCRGNRVAYPKLIQFSSSETSKGHRGDLHIATCQEPPMLAFSWLDGNPVNFLTTADGSELSEVQRRIGGQKANVHAPIAVARYNKNMQAVDRFDQLNQLFSLAKRHKFKKYYNLLAMALLDIALVNAEQHYFMVDGRNKHDEAPRYRFRRDLAQLFFDTKWEFFKPANSVALNSLFMSPHDEATRDTEIEINPCTLPLGRREEGVPRGIPNATTCHPIGVMAYLKQSKSNTAAGRSYRGSKCQGHDFYIPLGIWGQSPRLRYDKDGCPKTISAAIGGAAYKKRSEWLLAEGFLESPPKARGRKRKNNVSLTLEYTVARDDRDDDEPINHGDENDLDEYYEATQHALV